jgi:hypothetical protein
LKEFLVRQAISLPAPDISAFRSKGENDKIRDDVRVHINCKLINPSLINIYRTHIRWAAGYRSVRAHISPVPAPELTLANFPRTLPAMPKREVKDFIAHASAGFRRYRNTK